MESWSSFVEPIEYLLVHVSSIYDFRAHFQVSLTTIHTFLHLFICLLFHTYDGFVMC